MRDARFGLLTDPPASFVLVGGRVIDPSDGSDAVRDIAVRDGQIVESAADAERIDARGLIIAPGFCDLHVHLREPGSSGAETISSGTQAAAHGGFTTVCAMPNTDPPLDSADAVRAVASAPASARVRVIAAATRRRAGGEISGVEELAQAGAIGVSDDGSAVPSAELVADLLGRLEPLGLPLFEHAEDASVAGGGVMRAGAPASRLGLAGWPVEAEVTVVERDIGLAEAAGARLHLTHVSSARSLEAVRAAKARGVKVTCDVTPHHLALSDEWVGGSRRFSWEEHDDEQRDLAYDGRCRVNPPLASRDDALALLAGVEDGTVDAIATDHAPHPLQTKLVPFAEAAPGLIGLETALSIGLLAVEAGRLPLATLLAALSTRPAAIVGEKRGLRVGERADLVAFDPAARWMVDPTTLASASANTPLLGMELPGVVRLTVADGRVTYRS
ncbi:MAG TPA: dihydroorotase [Candidatus Limnocylindria bacterium]|nr:dihydroorotase [Candidatus Limnocylindria bacterium]